MPSFASILTLRLAFSLSLPLELHLWAADRCQRWYDMILMMSKSCLFEPSHFMMMCFVCAMCVWLTRVFHYYVFLSFILSFFLHHLQQNMIHFNWITPQKPKGIYALVRWDDCNNCNIERGERNVNAKWKCSKKFSSKATERASERERKRKIARPKDSEQKLNEMEWMGTGHHAYTIQLLSMGLLLDGFSHIHKWPLRSLNCLIGHCVN